MGAGEVSIVWCCVPCVMKRREACMYVSPPHTVSLQDVMDEDQPQVCVCVWVGGCVGGGRGIIIMSIYSNVVGSLVCVHMSGPHTE